MNGLMKKIKWFIIATLVVLVAGMTLFGIFGFNNTVDYANDSYELKIVIDQPLDDAKETLKKSANDYFAEKGIAVVSSQEIDEGMGLIFKFSNDVEKKLSDMQGKVDTSLASTGVKVDVFEYNIVHGSNNVKIEKAFIALAIGLVVIFIYTMIMERFASALAVCASYVISMLVFIALMNIVRVPAAPFVEVSMTLSAVLSAILSITTVGRLKEQVKNAEGKIDFASLSLNVMAIEKKKYVISLVAILIASLALIALFTSYTIYAGAQLLLAGVSAISTSYFLTPLIWTAIKAKNKK